MPRELNENIYNEIYSTETSFVFLELVTINHPDWVDTLYFVNNNESIIFETNTYLPTDFSLKLPSQVEGENNNARLSISNIERTLIPLLRTVTTPLTMVVDIVTVNTSTGDITREAGPYAFELANITYNKDVITGNLIYDFNPTKAIGTIRITTTTFPALQRIS